MTLLLLLFSVGSLYSDTTSSTEATPSDVNFASSSTTSDPLAEYYTHDYLLEVFTRLFIFMFENMLQLTQSLIHEIKRQVNKIILFSVLYINAWNVSYHGFFFTKIMQSTTYFNSDKYTNGKWQISHVVQMKLVRIYKYCFWSWKLVTTYLYCRENVRFWDLILSWTCG